MLIFITGTSSGIGAALSLHYAKPGNTLCLLSRNVAAMEQTATACRARGAQTIVYEGDVRDAKRMQEVGDAILKTAGTPDIVIANAGIRIEDPPSYVGCTAPLDIIMTNYIGVVNTFAPFIEPMTHKRAGHLVAITSIAAHRATPNLSRLHYFTVFFNELTDIAIGQQVQHHFRWTA